MSKERIGLAIIRAGVWLGVLPRPRYRHNTGENR